jgi:hypothetical protein
MAKETSLRLVEFSLSARRQLQPLQVVWFLSVSTFFVNSQLVSHYWDTWSLLFGLLGLTAGDGAVESCT